MERWGSGGVRRFLYVEVPQSLTQQLSATIFPGAGVCNSSVVKVTCNLLLVIAANGFLLESVQDCPIITLLSLAF